MTKRLINIAKGVGSIMDICPPRRLKAAQPIYTPPAKDVENLRSDWENVGKDLSRAMPLVCDEQK